MSACPYVCGALSFIGGAYLLYKLFKLMSWTKLTIFSKVNIKEKYSKAGQWAIVTGASDGIGLSMATELASRGLNIILISRTKAKLAEVASTLESKYSVKAHCIAFDFSSAGPDDYDKLKSDIDTFEIAILVNNVGTNYSYPQDYEAMDITEDLRLLKVNCESQLYMTKIVLSKMKTKRCGGIINLSSILGLYPSAKLTTYAATKAFNKNFSDSLYIECKQYGVDVLTVTPNAVISRMTAGVSDRKPRKTFITVDPDSMAKATVDKLGVVMSTDGHPHHGIIAGLLSNCLPVSLVGNIIYKGLSADEKRAIKKLEQMKKSE